MLAFEGIVVLALDIYRIPGSNLSCRCRVTTRGMWTDNGQMLRELHMVGVGFQWPVSSTPLDTSRCPVACWGYAGRRCWRASRNQVGGQLS